MEKYSFMCLSFCVRGQNNVEGFSYKYAERNQRLFVIVSSVMFLCQACYSSVYKAQTNDILGIRPFPKTGYQGNYLNRSRF